MGTIKQVRVINFRLLMKFIRKREAQLGGSSLMLELLSDQSGCLRNIATTETDEVWHDVNELNEIITLTLMDVSAESKQKLFNDRGKFLG